MIKFPCICQHNFAVEDDMAGGEIQCPKCGRLNDIPTLDQLKTLSSDGSIQIDVAPIPPQEGRVSDLVRVYSPGRTDGDGVEIDLRNTHEEIALAGVPDSKVDDKTGKRRPAPPRYDPVTGELIRPMDIRKSGEPEGDQIPMAKRTLSYARPDLQNTVSLRAPLLQLFAPLNLAVMFFMVIGHILLTIMAVPIFIGFFIVLPILVMVLVGVLAHYANVIEEIGVEERDELPRPMRHVSFADDFWNPLVHMLVAFAISYGPALLVYRYVHSWVEVPLCLILAALGTIVFPAALLTTVTSGNMVNLRPDRLFSVIVAIGFHYPVAIGLFIIAAAIYLGGVICCLLNGFTVLGATWGIYGNFFVAYGVLIAGIYLMHVFCWYLGLLYRSYHPKFAWTHQYHLRTTAKEAVAISAARQAVTRHRTELRKIDNETARKFLWW